MIDFWIFEGKLERYLVLQECWKHTYFCQLDSNKEVQLELEHFERCVFMDLDHGDLFQDVEHSWWWMDMNKNVRPWGGIWPINENLPMTNYIMEAIWTQSKLLPLSPPTTYMTLCQILNMPFLLLHSMIVTGHQNVWGRLQKMHQIKEKRQKPNRK